MQHQADGAGPSQNSHSSHGQPLQQQSQHINQQHASHSGISCLLDFQDSRIEAAYQHYMYKMQQNADMCLIMVNLFAVAVALVKQYIMPLSSGPSTIFLCMMSVGQSLLLLALVTLFPSSYARHRGLTIGCSRMYRLAVWLAYLRDPLPPRLFKDNLSMRLFLLSPAGGNVWLALFYPLPMSLHLVLLGLSTTVATWRSEALLHRLQHLGAAPEQLEAAYWRLCRFSRFFEMPSSRLLQHWPSTALGDSDQVWCMYSFVTLVYGLLLPLFLLFLKEVHFRVRFLSCLRPAISQRHLASLHAGLYSTTTAACFLIITMVPCAWSFVQLASRYLAVHKGPLRVDGLLFLVTVVSLEMFMRFWLLAVTQLVLQRLLRPALLWLLVRISGMTRPSGAAGSAARAGPVVE